MRKNVNLGPGVKGKDIKRGGLRHKIVIMCLFGTEYKEYNVFGTEYQGI